ncbi:hypothetical protein C8F01DRAFT_1082834 [Mycena amicta]|nr:hypothetical protein C8F01DRAFT_1082834 [Mycena amicta]
MSPCLASKLGTNYAPTDEETAQLRAHIVARSLRIKHLDDQLAAVERQRDALLTERTSIASSIAQHQALLSPMRQMPLDIMQEIFLACLPHDRNCTMSATAAPILLGRVCSSWRALSLATPLLWCRLHVAEPSLGTPVSYDAERLRLIARRAMITKEWLARSGTLPISISVTIEQIGTSELLDAVLPFALRWHTVQFTGPLWHLEHLRQLRPGHVPCLQSLSVAINACPTSPTQETKWTSLPIFGATSLTALQLWGAIGNVVKAPVDWTRLTILSYGGYSWHAFTPDKVLALLKLCPNLRQCKLTLQEAAILPVGVLTPTEPHSPDWTPFKLKHLHTIHLRTNGSVSPCVDFLSRVLLPNLRHVRIVGSGRGASNTFPATTSTGFTFDDFFRNRSPLQETLVLDALIFTKESLVEFVTALPSALRRLVIADTNSASEAPRFDDEVLRILTSQAPLVAPGLRELTVTNCSALSEAAVLRFLEARTGSQLKHAVFDFMRPKPMRGDLAFDPQVVAGLQRYLADDSGLPRLTICYTPLSAFGDCVSPVYLCCDEDAWLSYH